MTFEIHIEGKENIDRQIDGEEMAFCYPSYEFVDVSRDDGVEIEASDETTAYQFFRQFLSVFYSIAGNYPSELSNPKRITVKHDGCSKEYSHLSIIVRRRGDNLEVGIFDGMLDSSDIKIEWDEKELEATTEVDLLSFMQEVIDESTDYIEKIEPKKPDGISKKRILDLFETAEQIYEHTKNRSVESYEIDPTSDKVREYLYEEAYDQKSFSQFLVSTNIIYDEIARIQQENAVEEKYEALLSHDSDLIRQATAEALMEMPDVRAVEALLTQRWKDEPDLMPVVFEAAVECDGETVRDALIETLDFSNYPEIREAAVVQLQHYSGDDVVAALEETVANDSAETVQTAAREILEMVEE